jgi:hypothetical protein
MKVFPGEACAGVGRCLSQACNTTQPYLVAPVQVLTLQRGASCSAEKQLHGAQVTLVSADMRHWEAPEKADIIVSELLGSFGDNELSPECLDGAQRFLREGGISIPQV